MTAAMKPIAPLRRAAAIEPIQMTLGALIAAEPALERLLTLRLPAPVAYHVAKLARLVRIETAHFRAQREAFIREFGTAREPTAEEAAQGATSMIAVAPERTAEFSQRVMELAEVSVTIDWRPLMLADLGTEAVSGADLIALDSLIGEPE